MQKRYIDKIKKLLNLARRTTSANEAATAISQAKKLMEKHNISDDDVKCSDISKASSKGTPSTAKTPPEYVVHLAVVIALAFGVRWYLDRRYTDSMTIKNHVVYYGPNERPEIAAYAFDVLARQLNKGRRQYIAGLHRNLKPINRTARADAWCSGWVSGAYERITEFVVTESEKTLMENFRQKLNEQNGGMNQLEARKPRTVSGEDSAADDGWWAGRNAELNQGLQNLGAAATKLIEG